MCFWSECYATHKTFSAANYYANWAAGRFQNARRPKIIYISPAPRSHSGYNFPYLSGSGNFPFAAFTHKISKLARRHIYTYIFILMRVSPSCLFIKNGFLSFLSLSAPSRLFDFFCVFLLEIRRVCMMKTAFLWRSSITQNCPRTCTPHTAYTKQPIPSQEKWLTHQQRVLHCWRSEGRRLAGPLRLASLLQWILIFDEGLNYSISADG